MADLHFSCTSCGRCCQDLRLSLSVEEAYDWASRGGLVQLLCHAAPSVDDGNEMAAYKRARRFPARSGDVAIVVQVILAARFEGACPNLGADLRCRIYAERPNVCRIYPAEVIPGFELDPANKLCPSEAWSNHHPSFRTNDGRIVEVETNEAICDARLASRDDVAVRKSLASLLGVNIAALENEGLAVWTVSPSSLVEALDEIILNVTSKDIHRQNGEWYFMSLRDKTEALIVSAGARIVQTSSSTAVEYMPLY